MTTRLSKINRIDLIALLFISALVVMIYAPGLNGPLLLDDYPKLGIFFDNPDLSDDQLHAHIASNSAALKRPVSMLSFIGNYIYSGDNLFAWKLTNLLIHLFCGFVWYCFLKIVERILVIRSGINCKYLALIVTTVWLLHPLQVSTILYLVQRMAQLSALFIALGLLSYAYGRLKEIQGLSGRVYIWSSVILFFPLAILSKENGALLLPLVLVAEIFLFKFAASPLRRNEVNVFLTSGVLLPMAVGVIILMVYFDSLILAGYEGRSFTLGERLLTELRVICMYMGQAIFPLPSSMQFFYENLVVSESLLRPISTLASLVIILMLLASAWVARIKSPLFSFGIFFYFVSHLIESTIFPLEPAFEHRNYIGLLGLSVAGYAVLIKVFSKRSLRFSAYLIMVIVLSMTSATRAATWSSKTSFYNYYYKLNPESHRVVSIMAEELTNQTRYDHALYLLTGVNASGARMQSLYIKCMRGDDLSQINYKKLAASIASPLNNYTVTGVLELSNLGLDGKCKIDFEGYETFLSEISTRKYRDKDDKLKVEIYKAHYLWQQHKREAAFDFLESLKENSSNSPIPLYLAAEWALDVEDKIAAKKYLKQANRIAEKSFNDFSGYKDNIARRIQSAKDKE